MDKGRERREKSRTPKEERRERDKDKTKKVEKEKEPTKTEKNDSKNEQKAEEQTLERKRLDFSSATASTVDAVPMQEEHDQQLAMISEEDSKRRKKTRFSDSEDEHQENKEKPPSETSSKNRAKSETPSMALTTQRLQDMSVSTPVRGDGTKTPLRIPPTEIQKHRKTSSHSEKSGTSEEEMEEEEDETPATFEDMGQRIQQVKKKMRQHQEVMADKMHKLSEEIKDINYDVESHARTNAHLLHAKLQEDAKQASLVLSIEGFPKDASESDRRAFTDWILQQANSKDRASTTSLWNTRGELSTFINVHFSSGFHRNQVFLWFLEQFIYKRRKLYWWAMSTGRETNHEIRIRKAPSEDARLRGRFAKAAMEAINEGNKNEVEFYPSWNENAIREKHGHEYLVWMHFSYASATCEVFVDEPFYEVVAEHFETKLEEISRNTKAGKGSGKSKERSKDTRKGSSKGMYASMDFSFDSKIPFWCKFIQVHNWRTNIHVQQALKDEEIAKERQEQLDG